MADIERQRPPDSRGLWGYLRSVLLVGGSLLCISFLNFHFLMGVEISPRVMVLPFLVGSVFGGLLHHIRVLRARALWMALELKRALMESERLLGASMPSDIIARLKRGEHPIIDRYNDVEILFIDLVDFTRLAETTEPIALARYLDALFVSFEDICHAHEVRKLKTIGDAFVVVSGLDPELHPSRGALGRVALEVLELCKRRVNPDGADVRVRMGIHRGAVIAGVLGQDTPFYDLWGDTINVASRLESTGVPGQIACSAAYREASQDVLCFERRGDVEMKGKGALEVWNLVGAREGYVQPRPSSNGESDSLLRPARRP